jgi:hypothetical protein
MRPLYTFELLSLDQAARNMSFVKSASKALEYMNNVEKADYFLALVERCYEAQKRCTTHLEQFPGAALLQLEEYADLRMVWLENYAVMNKQNAFVYNFSMSDLLFSTLCFMEVAEKPHTRKSPPEDLCIESTIEVLRFMACQHTPETMHSFPPQELVQTLFEKVAWIIVKRLSKPLDVKTEAALNSIQHVNLIGKHTKKLSWLPANYRAKMDKLYDFPKPPETADGKPIRPIAWGSFFSLIHVSSLFSIQAARVMHALTLQYHVVLHEGILVPTLSVAPELKLNMQLWLLQACKIDSSDTFAAVFRDALFGSLLPLHCAVNATTRTGSAGVITLTLLQFELGFDVASKINDAVALRVRSIGYDPQHEHYDLIVMHMFGYTLRHEKRLEKFLRDYYVCEEDYTKRVFTELRTKHRFGRFLREPIIVRIQRRFYVHFYAKKDNRNKQVVKGNWMQCENAIEACLVWMFLLVEHNEGKLYTGHDLHKWTDRFLVIPTVEDIRDAEQLKSDDVNFSLM